jgi:hypothetical protein
METKGHIGVHKKYILARSPDRKRALGRPKCRWGDDIKTDLIEMGSEDVNCIQLDRNGV